MTATETTGIKQKKRTIISFETYSKEEEIYEELNHLQMNTFNHI